jgi:hypothetical protein
MHKAVPRLSIRILSAKPPSISWAKLVTILPQQGVLERIQVSEPGSGRPKLRQQAGIQIRIQEQLNGPRRGLNTPDRKAGRIKPERAGHDERRLPDGSLLDPGEQRRALIRCFSELTLTRKLPKSGRPLTNSE